MHFSHLSTYEEFHVLQGWFLVYTQPMRDGITLWLRLSLAGRKPRISPVLFLHKETSFVFSSYNIDSKVNEYIDSAEEIIGNWACGQSYKFPSASETTLKDMGK